MDLSLNQLVIVGKLKIHWTIPAQKECETAASPLLSKSSLFHQAARLTYYVGLAIKASFMSDHGFSLSNQEAKGKWAIGQTVAPYLIPLDELDPAHPALFQHDTFWPYFERMRADKGLPYSKTPTGS